MNKYGLRPPICQLEELAQRDLIDIVEEDGWQVTYKGLNYIKDQESNS